MYHLAELLSRISGVLLFIGSFMALVALNSGTRDYKNVVLQQLTDKNVYSEDNVQVPNEIFVQNSNNDFIVDGGYVMSLLLNDVTVLTKITDNSDDISLAPSGCSKFELVMETRLSSDVYYVLKDLTMITPTVKQTGVYEPGENFPLENFINIRGKYVMKHLYSNSGALECLQFIRYN